MASGRMSPDGDELQRRITAFWSTVAADYEGHEGNVVPVGSAEYAQWVELYGEALPAPPADVLDLGTGTGFVALIAAALGHRVTGVDLAEPMLAVARANAEARGLRVRLMPGDAVGPGFADGSFDAVTCRHLLWTLREPERAFAAWYRLLRPGGRLVAVDACWFADEAESAGGADEPPADDLFARHYTRDTRAALPGMYAGDGSVFVRSLEEAGFRGVVLTALPIAPAVEAAVQPAYLLVADRR